MLNSHFLLLKNTEPLPTPAAVAAAAVYYSECESSRSESQEYIPLKYQILSTLFMLMQTSKIRLFRVILTYF